jgi:hypothetical protein
MIRVLHKITDTESGNLTKHLHPPKDIKEPLRKRVGKILRLTWNILATDFTRFEFYLFICQEIPSLKKRV